MSAISIPKSVSVVLAPAYEPCPAFESVCRRHGIRFDPPRGHAPRGFFGATDGCDGVRLIIVGAEPGDPYADENHEGDGSPASRISSTIAMTERSHRGGRDGFHANMRFILGLFWPGLTFDEQMRRTWITDSVLCSAAVEGGNVRRAVWRECGKLYLARQFELFANAMIVALGAKAQERVAGLVGHRVVAYAWAAAPPGANRPPARESWENAARAFHAFLKQT